MKKVHFMEKLLDGVDVEWKKLGDEEFFEIANKGRKPVRASLRIEGETPYYGANNIQDYVEGCTHDGEYALIAEDGSASLENYSIQYAIGKFWANNHVHVIRGTSLVNTKFLYYYLKIVNFIPYLTGGGRAKLTKRKMLEIPIPIPPLKVQSEIVRILDNFTELTAELTVELSARKKQYEYYENELLFNSSFRKIPMSQICTVNQGLQIPISQRKLEDGRNRYLYITVQFIKDRKNKCYIENPSENVICDYEDILVARTGSTGKVITGEKGCFHNNFFKVNCFDIVNKRYIYYVLKSKKMYEKMLHTASGGTVPDLPHNKFYKLEIPIPPLEKQKEIVAILDKFDTLTNSISEGLPKEIALRQKQYEYYRNLLLSFPKVGETDA